MMLGLLLSLLAGPSIPSTNAAEILKTVSLNFNSETVPEDKHQRLRDKRFMAMTKWIRENQPDVVFIVEGWNYRGFPSIVKALGMATGYDYTYRLTMGVNGLMLDSNGIMIKPGHRFVETRSYKLPHASPTMGNGQTWIVSPGATSWGVGGKIRTAGGNTIYAYATHLIGKNASVRTDQLIGLHRFIEKEIRDQGESIEDANILFAGDFNEQPDSVLMNNMKAIGYRDSFGFTHPEVTAGTAEACTFCSEPGSAFFNPMTIGTNQFPEQSVVEGDIRIDYILSRGSKIKPISSNVAFTGIYNGVWMSDHFGVHSTFAVGSGADQVPVTPVAYRDEDPSGIRNQVVEVTPERLFCSHGKCKHSIGELDVSASNGVTFVNRTKALIHVDIEGTGRVWPSRYNFLTPGHSTAFFFDKGERYSFDTHHLMGIKVMTVEFNAR
jgi:hypothetical protein